MYLNHGVNFGAVSALMMGLGLSGCAANAESAQLKEERTEKRVQTEMVFVSKDGEHSKKSYKIEVQKDDGSKPIVITTTDPESPEFKAAMEDLKKQGIEVNLDMHEFHGEHMKLLELELDDLEGIGELKGFKLENGKVLRWENIDSEHSAFLMKDGAESSETLEVIEFGDDGQWVSEDGAIHVIKKLEDGQTVVEITKGEDGKKIFTFQSTNEKGDKEARKFWIEKHVIVTDDEAKESEAPQDIK